MLKNQGEATEVKTVLFPKLTGPNKSRIVFNF